jgi:hypothetical protein
MAWHRGGVAPDDLASKVKQSILGEVMESVRSWNDTPVSPLHKTVAWFTALTGITIMLWPSSRDVAAPHVSSSLCRLPTLFGPVNSRCRLTMSLIQNNGSGGSHRDASDSAYALIETLIPVIVVAIFSVLAFLILRETNRRIYAPRTYLPIIRDE